ncbi:hypothetical protein LINPERPRIM_LOCUS20650, partial [Linum perenne]
SPFSLPWQPLPLSLFLSFSSSSPLSFFIFFFLSLLLSTFIHQIKKTQNSLLTLSGRRRYISSAAVPSRPPMVLVSIRPEAAAVCHLEPRASPPLSSFPRRAPWSSGAEPPSSGAEPSSSGAEPPSLTAAEPPPP